MRKKIVEKQHTLCLSVLAIMTVLFFSACAEEGNSFSSPNGKIKVAYVEDQGGSFAVSYRENGASGLLVNVVKLSEVGIVTNQGATDWKLVAVSKSKQVVEDYTMLQGKRSKCHNEAIERTFSFKDSNGLAVDMIFRAYNDGIAFRYAFPDRKEVVVTDERTTYEIADHTKRWTQKLTDSYEDFYPMNTDGIGENEGGKWGYPALFEVSDSVWMLITEGDISRGDCGSWLRNDANRSAYKVELAESELPCAEGWQSPWRIAIIGYLSDVVESTLVTDVSTPCRLNDTSWITPGSVSWIYWAYNHGSKDYQIVKKYIDFAVDMQLPYVLIDWEWDEMANGGTLQDALAYAKEKGIKPLLWYNSSTAWAHEKAPGPLFRLNASENRNKEFKWLSEQGVKGIKVDFFIQDNASTMEYFIDLLEDAAKYELLINFHGATIPRGWQRTYPNLMAVEGVYGAEWYNNNPRLTSNAAWHNATLPFTRNVVGPMDYTPCTFTDSQHPHITSNAHELALLVMFESALQHLADRPEGYLSQPSAVQSFITNLPTVWEDTKLVSGYPSEYVVLARRKGDTWYVAGLNGSDEKKELSFKLDFIENQSSAIQLFSDGSESNTFSIESLSPDSNGYTIECLPRGGFVMTVACK